MAHAKHTIQLLKSFHKESYYWSLCCCKHDEDMAKDVLQNAYLKVLEKKARFDGQSKPKTWFFSVIKYTALDAFRKQGRATVALSTANELAEPKINAYVEIQDVPIKKILDRLSMQQREILTLVFYSDLTIEAAAKVLNISIGTARSHYSRAKANFKKWLEYYKKKQL